MRWGRKIPSSSTIREFVYLNDTAIESLLASTDGEILVEKSESSSRTRERSISASFDGLIGEATYTPTLKSSRQTGTSELRKSVAQSAFARFRNKNASQFSLRPIDGVRVRKRDVAALTARDPGTLLRLQQGIRVDSLNRGDLIEIDALITAADIFKARTAMNSIADVMEAYPSFLPIEQRDAIKAARPLTELIDKLNGDTIPARGQSLGLHVESIGNEQWLMMGGPNSEGPVTLDGSLQSQWLWGDPGRILFEEHSFRMLCRLVEPGITTMPASSYVATILKNVNPELAATVDGLGAIFLNALQAGHERARGTTLGAQHASSPAEWYGAALSAATGRALTDDLRKALRELPISRDFPDQVMVLDMIDELILNGTVSLDADLRVSTRDRLRQEFSLWPWSQQDSGGSAPIPEEGSANFLRVEMIAIYW